MMAPIPAPAMRSALFVPATRPERFAKALASGADAVIIDLEDAVEPEAKDAARDNLVQFAADHPQASFLVRINGAGTPWFEHDLGACGNLPQVAAIMLAKSESPEQVAHVGASGKSVLPLIESARGIRALQSIAATPAVGRLSFGTLDMMLDVGVTPGTRAAGVLLDTLRCDFILQSSLHGLQPPLDGVHPDIRDTEGLADAAGFARDLGFGGLMCIHPAQIEVVHRTFAPSASDLAWARRVVEQAEARRSSAFQLDGQMVDRPVIERARRIVARAGR